MMNTWCSENCLIFGNLMINISENFGNSDKLGGFYVKILIMLAKSVIMDLMMNM